MRHQALIIDFELPIYGKLGFRPDVLLVLQFVCPERQQLSSNSATLSQLPCLGVYTKFIFSTYFRARSGGNTW